MQQKAPSCIRCVDSSVKCPCCKRSTVKHGTTKALKQRYRCRMCKRTFITDYSYTSFKVQNSSITVLLKESVCIRGIGRILGIATNTVMSRIRKIAVSIPKPPIPMKRESFELDELRTFVGYKSNETWVAYAICPVTKEVVDFTVGRRSKRTLRHIIGNLLFSEVDAIKTDRLNIYGSLIPKERHIVHNRCTNRIERHNMNLRTHLKRLSRRTICFSRSREMLEACLKIYFWG